MKKIKNIIMGEKKNEKEENNNKIEVNKSKDEE